MDGSVSDRPPVGARFLSRGTLLWLCALAVLLNLFALASQTILPWRGDDGGIVAVSTTTPFTVRVTAVNPSAVKAGLHVGDLIDMRTVNRQLPLMPGQVAHVTALRNGTAVAVNIVVGRAPPNWAILVRIFTSLWLIVFAAMIAARGDATRRSLILSMVLLAIAIESAFGRIAYPSWISSVIGSALWPPIWVLSFVLLALYATTFAAPISRSRVALVYLTLAFAGLAVLSEWPLVVPVDIPWFKATQALYLWSAVLWVLPAIPCVLSGIAAFHAAAGGDRQRIAWVFVPFLIFWAVWAGEEFAHVYVDDATSWIALENAALLVVPLGLTYAALSRRLFDTGFVINRAAVFTGVSVIVVGSFVLLEWALGKWFEDASHATSIILNAALALGFGLSLRFVHRRVDRFVDTVFFKKRHDDESALKRFAREAAFVTDRETLLKRAQSEVLEHSEAPGVRILLTENLDSNDPAVLAMKTWHDAVELHDYATAISGEYAFPMLAHGQLVGVIICDAKVNGEAFAPDEIDTLKTVAHGVGVALHALSKGADDVVATLTAAIVMSAAATQEKIIAELRASRTI